MQVLLGARHNLAWGKWFGSDPDVTYRENREMLSSVLFHAEAKEAIGNLKMAPECVHVV